MDTPRPWSFATICSPRRRRAARVSRRNSWSRSFSRGRNSARTCSSPQGARTLNSQPGITRTPSLAPSCAASATPSVVSWSVSAIAVSPTARARRATSGGSHSPSDAVEWQCRSMWGVGDLGSGPGRLRLLEELEQRAIGQLEKGAIRPPGSEGREVRDAVTALRPRAALEYQPELVTAVDGHTTGGVHLPACAVDGYRATGHTLTSLQSSHASGA